MSGIYENLELEQNYEKLQEESQILSAHIKSLESDVARLCEEIKLMKKKEDTLTRNISELFNTAKLEINRKDSIITDLRKQLCLNSEPQVVHASNYKNDRTHESGVSHKTHYNCSEFERRHKRKRSNSAKLESHTYDMVRNLKSNKYTTQRDLKHSPKIREKHYPDSTQSKSPKRIKRNSDKKCHSPFPKPSTLSSGHENNKLINQTTVTMKRIDEVNRSLFCNHKSIKTMDINESNSIDVQEISIDQQKDAVKIDVETNGSVSSISNCISDESFNLSDRQSNKLRNRRKRCKMVVLDKPESNPIRPCR